MSKIFGIGGVNFYRIIINNAIVENLNQAYKEFSKNGYNAIGSFISKIQSKEDIIYNLLALHIDKIDSITSLLVKQTSTYNELFEFLAEYPDEIKFCKQLFIHRGKPEMNLVFLYGINAVKPILAPLLKSHFKLSENPEYFYSIWMTVVESWLAGLDINNLTAKQMKNISDETAEIIIKLNKL